MTKINIKYIIISSLKNSDDFERMLINQKLAKEWHFSDLFPNVFFRFKSKDSVFVFRGTDFLREENKKIKEFFSIIENGDVPDHVSNNKIFQSFFKEKFNTDNVKLKFFIHWGGGDPLTYRRYENRFLTLLKDYYPLAIKPEVTSISYANPFFKEILSSKDLDWNQVIFKLEWASSSSNLYVHIERVLVALSTVKEKVISIKREDNKYMFNELMPIWSLIKDNQELLQKAELAKIIQFSEKENLFLIEDKRSFRKLLKKIITAQGAELRPF